jgi:hypothetical protein
MVISHHRCLIRALSLKMFITKKGEMQYGNDCKIKRGEEDVYLIGKAKINVGRRKVCQFREGLTSVAPIASNHINGRP